MGLYDVPYRVDSFLCNGGQFLRWKRSHKRSRINKKWHKKYGYEVSKCSGVAVRVWGTFCVCPCIDKQVRELSK